MLSTAVMFNEKKQYTIRYSILQHAVVSATALGYRSLTRLVHIVRYHGYCAYVGICIAQHTGHMISKRDALSLAGGIEMYMGPNFLTHLDPVQYPTDPTQPDSRIFGKETTRPKPKMVCSSVLFQMSITVLYAC